MSSAIGDYIHLSYEGYHNGPEKGSGKPPFASSAASVIRKHQRDFANEIYKMKTNMMPNLQQEINNYLELLNNFQKANQGSKEYPEVDDVLMALLLDI